MLDRMRKYSDCMEMLESVELSLLRPAKEQLRMDRGDTAELMESIRSKGLLQPILVRPKAGYFEVVAGNRRYECCKKLRWKLIPCIVREMSDKEAYEVSLVENVQRNSLSPIEEAMAYKRYTEDRGWGSVKDLAMTLGKSESYVSHCISILRLPGPVLQMAKKRQIGRSAMQELLWAHKHSDQVALAKVISDSSLTVREVRNAVKSSYRIPTDMEESARRSPKGAESYKILQRAVLVIRMSLIRMDSLIEHTEDPMLEKFLMGERFVLHQMIDDIISRKQLVMND
jgi:ParB family transcriptional regulator, chromosome partitioning protein